MLLEPHLSKYNISRSHRGDVAKVFYFSTLKTADISRKLRKDAAFTFLLPKQSIHRAKKKNT